jgi:hypothetical protein
MGKWKFCSTHSNVEQIWRGPETENYILKILISFIQIPKFLGPSQSLLYEESIII